MTPGTLDLHFDLGVTATTHLLTFKDEDGAVVDLTGWSVWADCRLNPWSEVAFSLAPEITDAPGGQITLAALTDEQTRLLPTNGTKGFYWDLLLENPAGERLGPFLAGTVTVGRLITRPA